LAVVNTLGAVEVRDDKLVGWYWWALQKDKYPSVSAMLREVVMLSTCETEDKSSVAKAHQCSLFADNK
jgi:hypothetical protein